ILLAELIRVWKFFQDRIVPRRLEIFQRETENWIQPGAGVQHVKIERRELMSEMQLRIVIERAAYVAAQFLIDRPPNHVAHRVKIKMKLKRHLVIEADAFVVNR